MTAAGRSIRADEGLLESFVDVDLPYATNATGQKSLAAFSAEVRGTVDLNPALTADTPLAALFGGRGVSLGSIVIGDGTSKQHHRPQLGSHHRRRGGADRGQSAGGTHDHG